jgi:hypothetical protein
MRGKEGVSHITQLWVDYGILVIQVRDLFYLYQNPTRLKTLWINFI